MIIITSAILVLRAYLWERENEENGGRGRGKDRLSPVPLSARYLRLESCEVSTLLTEKGLLAVYPLLQELISGIVLKIAICEAD